MRNWKYAKKENYAVKKSEVPYTQKSSTDTVSDTFAFDPPPPDPDTLRVISVCADEGMPLRTTQHASMVALLAFGHLGSSSPRLPSRRAGPSPQRQSRRPPFGFVSQRRSRRPPRKAPAPLGLVTRFRHCALRSRHAVSSRDALRSRHAVSSRDAMGASAASIPSSSSSAAAASAASAAACAAD